MLTSDIKNYNERECHSASRLLSTFYSEQPSLSAKTGGSPNFHMHHLEGFLNTPLGPPPVWFNRSAEKRPQNLHFWQIPRWCWHCSSRNHILRNTSTNPLSPPENHFNLGPGSELAFCLWSKQQFAVSMKVSFLSFAKKQRPFAHIPANSLGTCMHAPGYVWGYIRPHEGEGLTTHLYKQKTMLFGTQGRQERWVQGHWLCSQQGTESCAQCHVRVGSRQQASPSPLKLPQSRVTILKANPITSLPCTSSCS